MSNTAPEGGHPAWEDFLTDVPDDLHPLLRGKLEEWDRNVNTRLENVHNEYNAYKPLVENNVDMESIQQALWLADQLEQNPGGVVAKAIEAFGLDYIPKDQQQQQIPDPNDEDFDMTDLAGLENHPAFKALAEKAEQADAILRQQQEQQQEQQAIAELDQYLEELHKTPDIGEFDDNYVTALMAQGLDGEDAVKEYQRVVSDAITKMGLVPGQQQQQTSPGQQQVPVVMGSEGNSGTGIPNETVNFAGMNRGSVNEVVMNYLAAQNQNQ